MGDLNNAAIQHLFKTPQKKKVAREDNDSPEKQKTLNAKRKATAG